MVESFELVTAQNYCLFAKKNRQRPTIYFFLLVKYKIRVMVCFILILYHQTFKVNSHWKATLVLEMNASFQVLVAYATQVSTGNSVK